MIHLDRGRLKGIGEVAAWLTGRRRRIRVEGDSMLPTLRAGQFVLVEPGRAPEPDQLVVARHPERPGLLVVKRVGHVEADGGVYLVSDNPASGTDSRTWGPVRPDSIEGVATLVLDSPSRPL